MAMYNFDKSIRDFARASFSTACIEKYPVYLSTKNTILKALRRRVQGHVPAIFDEEFKAGVRAKG